MLERPKTNVLNGDYQSIILGLALLYLRAVLWNFTTVWWVPKLISDLCLHPDGLFYNWHSSHNWTQLCVCFPLSCKKKLMGMSVSPSYPSSVSCWKMIHMPTPESFRNIMGKETSDMKRRLCCNICFSLLIYHSALGQTAV